MHILLYLLSIQEAIYFLSLLSPDFKRMFYPPAIFRRGIKWGRPGKAVRCTKTPQGGKRHEKAGAAAKCRSGRFSESKIRPRLSESGLWGMLSRSPDLRLNSHAPAFSGKPQ